MITGLAVGHTPHHANDGPASAFVVLDDGSTIDVDVEPMTGPEPTTGSRRDQRRVGARNRRAPSARAVAGDDRSRTCAGRFGVGWARAVGSRGCDQVRTRSATSGGQSPTPNGGSIPDGPWALGVGDDTRRRGVAGVDRRRPPWHRATTRWTIDDSRRPRWSSPRATGAGFRHGFVTLAQLLRDGAAGAGADRRRPGVRVAGSPRRSRPPVLPGVRRRTASSIWRRGASSIGSTSTSPTTRRGGSRSTATPS